MNTKQAGIRRRPGTWLAPLLLATLAGLVLAASHAAFRQARLTGTVRDAQTGQPVPAGQVWLGTTPVPTESGQYALSLPPGQWALQATAPGYAPQEASWDTRVAHPRRRTLDFYLRPRVLSLRVYDAGSNAPLAGAWATAGTAVCRSDTGGECQWLRLHGRLTLRVEAAGYLPHQVLLSAAETARHQEQRNPLHVRLSPSCLSIQVRDGAGQPVPGAEVLVGSRPRHTDERGQVQVCRVPDTLDVAVEADGFDLWLGQSRAGPEGHIPLRITLRPNRIPGRVLAADTGQPVPGARVTASSGQETFTTPAGDFVLRGLRRGDEGRVEAKGYRPLHWQYAGQDHLELRLEPVPIAVEVRDALSGQPVAGAWVGAGGQWVQADTAGRAALYHLRPGEATRATGPGHLAAGLTYTGQVTVTHWLLPTALQGTVRDASTGQPVPHAWLYTSLGLVRADELGRYRLEGYAQPPTLTVKAAGYRQLHLTADPDTLRQAGTERSLEGPAIRAGPDGKAAHLDLLLTPHAVRALYISMGRLTSPAETQGLLQLAAESDLNGVVVDVKGDKGRLSFRSRNPLAQEAKAFRTDLVDLEEILEFCREKGLYTVARLVVFKDPTLAATHPEWALHRADGSLWHDEGGAAWLNPYRRETWDYNIALAREVADLGFDEVQLDYVRFPSDGAVGEIDFGQESTRETRTATIRAFAEAFAEAMRDKDVFTAVDVFGLTVTVHPESDMGIGQRVKDLVPFMDYLCPMVYPSTFIPGNLGLENPFLMPYQVVYRSVQEAIRRVPNTSRVRPWLQHYYYGPDELLAQRQGAEDAGGCGWMFWNVPGNYPFPEVFSAEAR